MNRLKSILGYTLAVLSLFVVLATFIANHTLAELLITTTGIEVSPEFTGGRVLTTIEHGDYRTVIHEPFFKGLFVPGKQGILRVDFEKVNLLPESLAEDIDYTGDGQADFRIEFNRATQQTLLTPLNPLVLSLDGVYLLEDAYALRVDIKNPQNP